MRVMRLISNLGDCTRIFSSWWGIVSFRLELNAATHQKTPEVAAFESD